MVIDAKSALEARRFDKDSISTVFSASSTYTASLVLDELKDKHRAQLGIVESQDSAIRDVVLGLYFTENAHSRS